MCNVHSRGGGVGGSSTSTAICRVYHYYHHQRCWLLVPVCVALIVTADQTLNYKLSRKLKPVSCFLLWDRVASAIEWQATLNQFILTVWMYLRGVQKKLRPFGHPQQRIATDCLQLLHFFFYAHYKKQSSISFPGRAGKKHTID